CQTCSGTGRQRKKRTATINVPAGIDNGQVIVMNGQGEPGTAGGPRGDLQVVISVTPHRLFARDGTTLYLDMPITFTQAALGATIEIPTLGGKTSYKMPEGTQDGAKFRIKGEGIKQLHGSGKGDLVVRVRVEIPKRMNNRQKELLKEFEKAATGKEYEEQKSFLEKVKSVFQ
ncbi:MAG: DnaJ C-terminal domain-containing protein, partial [Eubacteriales bacterium]|nr:DnaJ C-terminal domain-containing protein [Eubacteriales bacterium]